MKDYMSGESVIEGRQYALVNADDEVCGFCDGKDAIDNPERITNLNLKLTRITPEQAMNIAWEL